MNSKTILKLLPAILILLSVINQSHALEIDDLDSYLYPKTEKTISMDFTEATLENVLKIFSQQSGLNFIVSTDIASKTVSLYLDNVPVEEALERILSAHNLAYEITPGSTIFTVKALQTFPDQLMTRVYPLKFATVPSSEIFSTLSNAQGSLEREEGEVENIKTGIIAALSAVLSERGKVVEDTRTNSLIVSDIPSQFPLIESTITQLDVRIPLILIEVELLDISKSTADDMGIKFGDTSFGSITPASRSSVYPFNPNRLAVDTDNDGNQLFDKSFTTGIISFPALAMTMDFLRSRTDTKNLARPRILTLNNHTAEIAIVTDQAIGIATNTTSAEGTASTTSQAERVKTGVSLRVTPQANVHTREIIMAIEPSVSDVNVSKISPNIFDPETRGSKSILRIRDGDTIVLGGLLRTKTTNIKESVPILSKIPFLGMAFRHIDRDEAQRELIIFITPHILDEDVSLKTARLKPKKIIREQSVSSNRTQTIEKDLLRLEKKYFNAYK